MSKRRSTGPAALLAGRVRAARHRYRKRLARCQKNFSEKAVHGLRIETRRMLALLELLEALGTAAARGDVGRDFKKRLDQFADLRDTQVQLTLLKPMWSDFPEAECLKRLLKRREAKLVSKLAHRIQATKSARLNRQLKEIERCIPGSHRISGRSAAAALRLMFRRVAACRQRVDAGDPAAIHRLRVAFKRFRYVSELLRPLHPEFTAKRLERMKEYQAAAGNIQDLEVLLARLARVIDDGKIRPASLRNLRAALRQRRRDTIAAFMDRIDELTDFQPAPG